MTTFNAFKCGAAREPLGRIGFQLSNCVSWSDFRTSFIEQNRSMRDKDPDDCLVTRARSIDPVLSTGERLVLHAALAAADFAHLSNEMWEWGQIDNLDRLHREAIAATILREDAE